MKPLAGLAAQSLWNRRDTALLTVLAIAVSVALLLGVQKLRHSARESFAATISGTDLVVGARTGPLNLLLYSVFRIGEPTANVSWQVFETVTRHRDVAWTIPLSLGDSYRGYRVVGTSADYFRHYRYGEREPLRFASGGAFANDSEAVLGAEVARRLGIGLGTSLVLAHGLGTHSFVQHDQHPVRVVGILAPTGTPVDRAVHVSLAAIDALHPSAPGASAPRGLSAFLVGMKSRDSVLLMQRALNQYDAEALQAVIPGVALAELWAIVGVVDRVLMLIAACVAAAGVLGMLAMLLAGLNERRREMAILRALGAGPRDIGALLLLEAALLALAGVGLGIALAYLLLHAVRPWIATRYGLVLPLDGLSLQDVGLLALVCGACLAASVYPAWRAYRQSLADGLSVRL